MRILGIGSVTRARRVLDKENGMGLIKYDESFHNLRF